MFVLLSSLWSDAISVFSTLHCAHCDLILKTSYLAAYITQFQFNYEHRMHIVYIGWHIDIIILSNILCFHCRWRFPFLCSESDCFFVFSRPVSIIVSLVITVLQALNWWEWKQQNASMRVVSFFAYPLHFEIEKEKLSIFEKWIICMFSSRAITERLWSLTLHGEYYSVLFCPFYCCVVHCALFNDLSQLSFSQNLIL